MKKTTILILSLFFLNYSTAFAANNCDEMGKSVSDARANFIKGSMENQSSTVSKPPEALSDMSCFDKFSSAVDIGQYDPASIMQWAQKFAKSLANQACQAAMTFVNGQLSQVTSMVNSQGNLPYGLGKIYNVSLSSSQMGFNITPPSASSMSSSVFSKTSSSIPTALPF